VDQSKGKADFERKAAGDALSSLRHIEALKLWLAFREERGALPARRDFDPLEMPQLLAWVTLVDVVPGESRESNEVSAPVRYRARLVGTEITQRHGRDVTGKFDDELYEPVYLHQIRTVYGCLRREKLPCLVTCCLPVPERQATIYERLLLPLAGDGEEVDMIMSVFDYPDPNRFRYERAPVGRSEWRATLLEL